MSVDTVLRSAINALPEITGGCHNKINTNTTVGSIYVVFHEISSIPENGITQYLGVTQHRYQVDVFAQTLEEAKGLALGVVKTAIEDSTLEGTLIHQMSGQYSEQERTFQYITEYRIWAVSP